MIELPISDIGMRLDENWNTCVKLLGPDDTLPIPDNIENLYLDFETTSEHYDIASINPHKHCKLLGVAVLFDEEKIPYYIPLRHCTIDEEGDYYERANPPNVSKEKVYDWLKIILSKSKKWINHNIKYDLHVLYNEIHFYPKSKLIDTLTLCKLASIEERFSYGLTQMMSFLDKDIECYEVRIKAFLGKKYKDYGLIPTDVMAPYAAVDTLCVRYLYHWLQENISNECERIVDIEQKMLPILFGIEQIGLHGDVEKLEKDWKELVPLQQERIKKIQDLSGYYDFDPSKKESQRELFCERLGWELDLTAKSLENLISGKITEDEITYSFGYASLMKHYTKNPELTQTYMDYQETQKLLTSFTLPYLSNHLDGYDLMHSSYNQIVRTGRMSCTNPNMQQLSPEAKEYIIPYNGNYILVEFDLSQIEFRVIVHYINNRKCIEDFNRDLTTDFHTWVAQMCNIPRKPAKNVNFMLGYGGGRDKCIAMLSELPDIIGELKSKELISMRANEVYNSYHATLPELKPTQWRASEVLRSRGYVRTLLGRHRYLPRQLHFKAFNSVCQGSAADIQKDVTIRLSKFINQDCLLHALVHDSWLFSIRKDKVNELIPEIKFEIEKPIEGVQFSVPIISEYKTSDKNWRKMEKAQ